MSAMGRKRTVALVRKADASNVANESGSEPRASRSGLRRHYLDRQNPSSRIDTLATDFRR